MGFGDVKSISIGSNADFSYSSKDISVDSVNTNSFNMNSVIQADQKNYNANSMNKNVIEELDLSTDTKKINNNTPVNAPTNSTILDNNSNQNTTIFGSTSDNTNTPQDILNNQNTDEPLKTALKLPDTNTNNNNGNVNAKTDIVMGNDNTNPGRYAYANPDDAPTANGIGGNTNGDNDSKTGVTALNFGYTGLNQEVQDVLTNSKGVHSTGNGITNKNEFKTEELDLNSVTTDDIQNMVGKLSYADYKDFIDGVEKYYENQEEYLNKLLNGDSDTEGFNDIYNRIDFTELYQVWGYDPHDYENKVFDGWFGADYEFYDMDGNLITFDDYVGISYDEFKKKSREDQISIIDGVKPGKYEFEGYQQDQIDKKVNDLLRDMKYAYDNEKIIDSRVEEKYGDLGITTAAGLVQFSDEMYTNIDNLKQSITNTKNNKDSANFDYLYFLEDYQNYEFKTEFTSDEIETLKCSRNVSGEYHYTMYHEQYPDVSLVEYLMMINEVEPNALVYDLNQKNITYYGSDIKTIADIGPIAPQLAKTYQYYLENDPDQLSQFMKDCEYEINQYKGQVEAQSYLADLYDTCSEDGFTLDVCKGIANELGVAWEGLGDGVDTFGEGLYYVLEAAITPFTGEENRSLSVDEYKKMYIMQALLSTEDKINLGLIMYDDDGNLVNTNPNCPIDYTKSYNGGLLSQNYQLTQGIGNMIPSMTIALANPTSIAGSVVFGLSAGGNAYHTSMVEGNSYMASLGYGIFTGSSESITQKMLGGIPGLSDAEVTSFKTYLDSVGREAFQESFQATMDYIYKASFMGYELPTTPEGWEAIADDILTQGAYGAVTAGFLNCKPGVQINFKDGNVNTNTGINTGVDVDIDTDTNTGDFDLIPIEEKEILVASINTDGAKVLNDMTGAQIMEIIQYCQETNQTDIITEIMSYENVTEPYFLSLTTAILEPSLNYYEQAAVFSKTAKNFKTYRDHCEKHVQEVAIKSLQAAENIKASLEANPVNGFSSDIDPYECYVAGIWHDTGMAAGSTDVFGLDTYIDDNGDIKARVLVETKNGDVTRSNHSFNSAMYVLANASDVSAYGVDTNIISLLCFAHSKSNSGVSTLNSEADWSVCINKINEGVIEYNKQNPDNPIVFANTGGTDFIESLVASGVLENTDYNNTVYKYTKDDVEYSFNYKKYNINSDSLAKLASEAYAIRLGDANTNNSNIGTNQAGEKIDFSSVSGDKNISFETTTVDKEGNTVSKFNDVKAEIKKEVPNLSIKIGEDTVSLQPIGAAFILGEENINFSSNVTEDGFLIEKFEVKNPADIPACTVFNIDERLGEVNTAKKGGFQTVVEIELDSTNVAEDQKADIEKYYEEFIKSRGYSYEITWK